MTTLTPPWIYLAGPLFTQAEIDFNAALAEALRSQGYRVYLPQQACAGTTDPAELYRRCLVGLEGTGLVLAILDGTDADSGTCFELGYAHAQGRPTIGLRTDFRGSGEHLGLNLMLTHSCDRLLLRTLNPPPSPLPHVTYMTLTADIATTVLAAIADYPPAQTTRLAPP